MTLLTRLERKIGFLTVHNLPLYIVTAQALVYLYSMMNPGAMQMLVFDPMAIQYGKEYWRLVTGLFITPLSLLWAFFFVYLLYIYGSALEAEWGSFPYTLYYLVGVLGVYLAGFVFGSRMGAYFLHQTIFLAFAALFPDYRLYLFFVIPFKVKWLAWILWAYFLFLIVVAPIQLKAAILISLGNYFLFFGKMHVENIQEKIQQYKHRQKFKDWNQ